jgi:hypothetical protein
MRQTRRMSLFSHPFKKLTLAAAFGIGYTLGAKAGRERYEQIKNTAQQVKDDPRVQDAAAKAEDLVRDTATTIKDDPRVQDAVHRAEGLIGDVKDAVHDDDLVDKAKVVASDVKDKATDVASDVKDAADDGTLGERAKDVASDVKDRAAEVADDAAGKAKHVADRATDTAADAADTADQKVSPLLADEHVESTDEVVYSAGPDIEESIDELAPSDDKDRI